MPNWGEILNRLNRLENEPSPMDRMRRKYLDIMHQYTGRNIIAYYSCFIQKPDLKEIKLTIMTKMLLCRRSMGLIDQRD